MTQQNIFSALVPSSVGAPVTMSSREIAELIEKQHSNIKVSADRLAARGVIGTPAVREFVHNNNTYTEYRLCKRDSLIVVAQNAVEKLGVMLDAWGRTEKDLQAVLDALDAFDVPDECVDMYVYAIRNMATGNIKLGISRDPRQRLKQLQTGNDCTLKLVAYRKAERRFQDETALHHAHVDARIRGEWFNQSASSAFAQ